MSWISCIHFYFKGYNKNSVIIPLQFSQFIINFLSKGKQISRESIQRLDLLLLALETIDLNGADSLYSLSSKLQLTKLIPNKVSIWKLRNNNPLRNSFNNNNIKLDEFEALIKLTAEMAKFLYPYIRQILQSRDDLPRYPKAWNDFKNRYIELMGERFNTNSMKVKRLLDPDSNDEIIIKIMLTLALCISKDGFLILKDTLINY